jgi:hypothetical protein
MSNIYFVNKGSTARAGVQLLWPTRHLNDTPKEFLNKIEPGLFVCVNPTCIKKTHYQCCISVIHTDNMSWHYREHLRIWTMYWQLTAHATYEKGKLRISVVPNIDDYNVDRVKFWSLSHNSLELIREAVEEIDKYFPTKPQEGMLIR